MSLDNVQLKTLQEVNNDLLDKGVWTGAPAIPASTVAQTNNSGYDAWIHINGGTVTVVTVDGVTIAGVTSGWIPVRAGSTWSMTYSVVPTSVQWFLHA